MTLFLVKFYKKARSFIFHFPQLFRLMIQKTAGCGTSNKKLSYRRETSPRTVSVELLSTSAMTLKVT